MNDATAVANDALDDDAYGWCRDCWALHGEPHRSQCEQWAEERIAREDRDDEIAVDFRDDGDLTHGEGDSDV